ncbi:MAG: hypothetical protein ABI867_26520 [Kofleriaceae bacterium]
MRALVLVALVACSSKDPPPAPAPVAPRDAAVDAPAATEWGACKKALEAAPKLPANRRVAAVIEGCQPCGDWAPLLRWDTQQVDGGPSRAAIEAALAGCKAFCDGNAKQRFLATLDNARGKGTRGPWRFLGEICKAGVSAVPDTRYMSAPYFALDRIGRAAAERPELAPLLAALELPLPALSVAGTSLHLSKAPVTAPDLGPLLLTVTAKELRLAVLARGTLGKDGVTVVAKGDPYPGALVTTAKDFTRIAGELGDGAVSVLMPRALPASRLLDVLAVTGKREVRIAVEAIGGPPGWDVAGTIPVLVSTTPAPRAVKLTLDEDPDPIIKDAKAMRGKFAGGVTISITAKTRVEALAKLVGALVYFDLAAVTIDPKVPP